ncbi:hypothetical protein LBW62_11760 [Ralstonia solanacearum]|uniref:Uncharacterized protein n=1 Tax=Ralstonia solanacearum TaxID=305 RepID=A0AAE3NIF5_RALSL|nr:hypothetical protein [Ralstonia solanacearum]MBB6581678.1 hypothetical protein [Ralstonia solanacearum]MBB6591527.1 hypothetical protein [Ralstonia solanacearum]MBB6595750.1 hypothetical protein [Ralstonia solanacearum]MDB0523742.1 hypothetical protein [Ralstonia solanacearum]MDB0541971.1 hypothetical protein [Ralstonia solanacearum]
MDDLNQVAATLAAAIFSAERVTTTTMFPGMPVMQQDPTPRIVELYREVRQQLIETQSSR